MEIKQAVADIVEDPGRCVLSVPLNLIPCHADTQKKRWRQDRFAPVRFPNSKNRIRVPRAENAIKRYVFAILIL
jgi:hypothetical protein